LRQLCLWRYSAIQNIKVELAKTTFHETLNSAVALIKSGNKTSIPIHSSVERQVIIFYGISPCARPEQSEYLSYFYYSQFGKGVGNYT